MSFRIELTTPACPIKDDFERAVGACGRDAWRWLWGGVVEARRKQGCSDAVLRLGRALLLGC